MMLIFTFIFGRVAKVPSEGFPYPVFVFAGLIPWTLFSQGFAQASLSLVNQQQLLTKVYFPRMFVPAAAASVYLVDLAISLGIYAIILLYYRVVPSWTVVFLPLLVLLTLLATLGIGLTLSALTVFYRDFRHIVPFLIADLPVCHAGDLSGQHDQAAHGTAGSCRSIRCLALSRRYRSAILGLEWDLPVPGDFQCSCVGRLFVRHVLLSQNGATLLRLCIRRDRLARQRQ